MGNQQNPDGIYIPPGINKRYPLDFGKPRHLNKMSDEDFPREGEGDDV